MTNNYIKLAAVLEEPRFFFFDQRVAEEVMAAYAEATAAKLEHDLRLPLRGSRKAGSSAGHLSIWKKCHLLRESVPEVGEFVEIVPVPHEDALVS